MRRGSAALPFVLLLEFRGTASVLPDLEPSPLFRCLDQRARPVGRRNRLRGGELRPGIDGDPIGGRECTATRLAVRVLPGLLGCGPGRRARGGESCAFLELARRLLFVPVSRVFFGLSSGFLVGLAAAGMFFGFPGGLCCSFASGFVFGLELGVLFGLARGLGFGFASGFLFGPASCLLLGLACGLCFGFLTGQLFRFASHPQLGLTCSLLFGFPSRLFLRSASSLLFGFPSGAFLGFASGTFLCFARSLFLRSQPGPLFRFAPSLFVRFAPSLVCGFAACALFRLATRLRVGSALGPQPRLVGVDGVPLGESLPFLGQRHLEDGGLFFLSRAPRSLPEHR